LYGCAIGCPTLREVHRLRVSEIRVLRKSFGLERKRNRKMEKFITRSFIIYNFQQILFG
jgi:hypothetical protein